MEIHCLLECFRQNIDFNYYQWFSNGVFLLANLYEDMLLKLLMEHVSALLCHNLTLPFGFIIPVGGKRN